MSHYVEQKTFFYIVFCDNHFWPTQFIAAKLFFIQSICFVTNKFVSPNIFVTIICCHNFLVNTVSFSKQISNGVTRHINNGWDVLKAAFCNLMMFFVSQKFSFLEFLVTVRSCDLEKIIVPTKDFYDTTKLWRRKRSKKYIVIYSWQLLMWQKKFCPTKME